MVWVEFKKTIFKEVFIVNCSVFFDRFGLVYSSDYRGSLLCESSFLFSLLLSGFEFLFIFSLGLPFGRRLMFFLSFLPLASFYQLFFRAAYSISWDQKLYRLFISIFWSVMIVVAL